jgi:hypothetical protein
MARAPRNSEAEPILTDSGSQRFRPFEDPSKSHAPEVEVRALEGAVVTNADWDKVLRCIPDSMGHNAVAAARLPLQVEG